MPVKPTRPAQRPAPAANRPAQRQPQRPAAQPAQRQAARPAQRQQTQPDPADDEQHEQQEQTREVATRSGRTVAEAVPDYMKEYAGMGTEDIGRDEILSPRLKLMQGLSPELQDYNELRPGHFLHTTDELILTEPTRCVIIIRDTRYILWRPRDSGGGILARADDGINWSPAQGEFTVQLDKKDGGGTVTWKMAPTVIKSGLHNWGTSNPKDPGSPPAATRMFNYLLAFPDYPEVMPAVLTLQRSSEKQGKDLNGRLLRSSSFPIFGLQFTLSSFQDTNSKGQDFMNVRMESAGRLPEQDLFQQYAEMHMSLKQSGLRMRDEETLQEDVDADTAGSDDGPGY